MDSITSDLEDATPRRGNLRACDQCRQRKVRCHKTSSSSTCDNCHASNLTCSSNGSGLRPKEPKTRVLISSQYEKKIDQIDERLDNIERLLQNLARGNTERPTGHQTHSVRASSSTLSPSESTLHAPVTVEQDSIDSQRRTFEGDSSLTAHTAAASQILRDEIQQSSLQNSNPAIDTALFSLHEIVSKIRDHSSSEGVTLPSAKALPPGGLSELPMPPMQAVLAALHGTKGLSQLHSTVICCYRSIESFTELCLKVYFTYGKFSQAEFIISNAGLYYIFLEYSFISLDDDTRNEYGLHAELCRRNLETALANLGLMLPHTYDSVEALLLGATYAIEMSRTSLAWLLNSTAITIGQTLGFHRSQSPSAITTGNKDNHDDKTLLFWMAYSLDKGLALRLGYAPLMSDNDIDVSMSAIDLIHGCWSDMFRAWVFHARLQGRIYDQLYCAAALMLPASQRQASIPPLVADMRAMISEALQMAAKTGDLNQGHSTVPENYTLRSVMVHANLVSFLGSLTLIYRAGGDSYDDDCLQSEREAMEMHIRSLEMLDKDSGVRDIYLHWAILYIPFVPFTVIFCHVIKSPDQPDIDRLERFVQSLQSSCTVSDSIAKLHMVCNTLFNVASKYIEMKTLHQIGPIEERFNKYLNALGLMPSYEHNNDEELEDVTRDWYSSNGHMMGLLE